MNRVIFTVIFFLYLLMPGCKSNLPVLEDLNGHDFHLLTQDSLKFDFPNDFKGKIVVMGFIFTNCPDICPLTTNNLRLIQERIRKDNISNVEIAALSFDPEVDTPGILKKYAEIRGLSLSNWTFLTGEKEEISKLIKECGVFAIPSDTVKYVGGKDIYLYVHTDRISLIDPESRIRKNYSGSKINVDEIINDIKLL